MPFTRTDTRPSLASVSPAPSAVPVRAVSRPGSVNPHLSIGHHVFARPAGMKYEYQAAVQAATRLAQTPADDPERQRSVAYRKIELSTV